jgi:hypothetical protein
MPEFLTEKYLFNLDVVSFRYNDKDRVVVILSIGKKTVKTFSFTDGNFRIFRHDKMVGVQVNHKDIKRLDLCGLPSGFNINELIDQYETEEYTVFVYRDDENNELDQLIAVKL